MRTLRPIALFVLATLLALPARAEDGTFELYELRHRIGQEKWTADEDGAARVVTATTSFDDRHSPVRLKTSLRVTAEGGAIVLAGTISRFARLEKTLEASDGAFPIHGFAPFAAQRELVKTWSRKGRPPSMKRTGDELRFEKKGTTEVQEKKLERWSLAGLVWGEETLFLDQDELVACITWDAEADRFAAIRPDFAKSLDAFEAAANEDQLARFPAAARSKKPIAIVGGTVLLGDTVEKQGVVVIEGDRIVAAGPKATVTVPEDAERIDATGKTVLPGLWDMHAHYEQAEWGPVYLAAGVTTARDCGNELDFLVALRDGIEKGRVAGPRILVAGLVDATKGGWGTTRAETADQAREVVLRFKKLGFQQVKVYDSIQKPVLEALAKAAHENGMTVTGHVPNTMTALEAVERGLDQISHVICAQELGGAREQEALALFKERGTVIDPTLAIYELIFRPFTNPLAKLEPGLAKVPGLVSANLEGWGMEDDRGAFARATKWIKTLHREGVPIVAGSDQCVPGHSLHHELELYVTKCGFTPREAIASATSVPAQVMKIDDAGTIAAGKRADLVIVDGDPLETISDIRKVWKTIAAGRVYDAGEQWERVGFRK
jgi:imidazolonepropionase-like amidohydrolase